MEEAVVEELLQKQIRAKLAQLHEIRSSRSQFVQIRRLDAVDEFHHEDLLRAILFVNPWDMDTFAILELMRKTHLVRHLARKIQLLLKRILEFLHDFHGPQEAELFAMALQGGRQLHENLHIQPHALRNARPLDFHENLRPVLQLRKMALRH